MAALKTFEFPGEDSRCVRYDGRVYKIKTMLTAPENTERQINDYLDKASLQKEVENIICAVLAVPIDVKLVVMRTEHLVVKPERKRWKLPDKIDFLENGQVLDASHFMFVLRLQLIEKPESIKQSNQITVEKPVEKRAVPSPKLCHPDKKRRQLFSEEVTVPAPLSGPKTVQRANTRRAPPRDSVQTKHRYTLRKRALKLSRRPRVPGIVRHDLSPDAAIDMGREEGWVSGDEGEKTSPDIEMGADIPGGGDCDRETRAGSPILESGFSMLVQRNAAIIRDRGEPASSHVIQPSTGDLGPSPAKPSDEEVARVGIPIHPGREVVERHVMSEQMRLQQMASPATDPMTLSSPRGTVQSQTQGVFKQMIDAVVTPVKNLFSNK